MPVVVRKKEGAREQADGKASKRWRVCMCILALANWGIHDRSRWNGSGNGETLEETVILWVVGIMSSRASRETIPVL